MKTKSHSKPAVFRQIGPVDYVAINTVLERELDLAWTAKNQESLRCAVGAKNHQKIEEIISFASNQEAWLNSNNLSSAVDVVSGKLSQHYPQLSPVAVAKIVNHAAYGWR